MSAFLRYFVNFVVVLLFVTVICIIRAYSMDHGFDPNSPVTEWFESKKLPPVYATSCCGKGDAYVVDDYWPNPDGSYTAVIADGSAIEYPDGTRRRVIKNGTHVHVPKDSVNREEDDLDNPINHSVIWLYVNDDGEPGTVWCFIRHPKGM